MHFVMLWAGHPWVSEQGTRNPSFACERLPSTGNLSGLYLPLHHSVPKERQAGRWAVTLFGERSGWAPSQGVCTFPSNEKCWALLILLT